MPRVPRRFVLLAGLATFGMVGVLRPGSGTGLSPEERRLVGRWRRWSPNREEEQGLLLTFSEDRTFSLERLNLCSRTRTTYFIRGNWSVDRGQFRWENRISSHRITASLPRAVDQFLSQFLRFGQNSPKSPLRFLGPDRLQLDLEEWGIEGDEYDRAVEQPAELAQK